MPHNKHELRTEDRLLRYCARTIKNASPAFVEKITKAFEPSLDWAYFLKRARIEQVAPLIYKAFSSVGAASIARFRTVNPEQVRSLSTASGRRTRRRVMRPGKETGAINRAPTPCSDTQSFCPPEIFEVFKEDYYRTLSVNILRFRQLEEILAAFNKENIPAIILKGPVLAETVYADLGLRQFTDLDLLIKEKDLLAADKALGNLDYSSAFTPKDLKSFGFNNYRNSLLYSNLDKQKIPAHIYWHIINLIPYNQTVSLGINLEKMWKEAPPLKIGGASAYTFSGCHQLLYLSMHALSHAFSPLSLLSDLNEFLRVEGPGLDWPHLVSEAKGFGLAKEVYYSLFLTSRILEAQVPETALAALKPKRISLFERHCVSSILNNEPVDSGEWMLLYFGMNESLQKRLEFLFRALFPKRREMAIIRQKALGGVSLFDYGRRIYSGVICAKKIIDKFIF